MKHLKKSQCNLLLHLITKKFSLNLGVAVNCSFRRMERSGKQSMERGGSVVRRRIVAGTRARSTSRALLSGHSAPAASYWKDTYADAALNIRSSYQNHKMQIYALRSSRVLAETSLAYRILSNAVWLKLSYPSSLSSEWHCW